MPVQQEDFSAAWRVMSSPAAKRYIDMMEEHRAEERKQSSKRQCVGAQLLHSLPMDSGKSSNNNSEKTMGAGASTENPAGVIGDHLPAKNGRMDDVELAMQDEEFSPEKSAPVNTSMWANPSDNDLEEVMRALETPPPYADVDARSPAPLRPSTPRPGPPRPSTPRPDLHGPSSPPAEPEVLAPDFLKSILEKNIFLSGKLRKNTFINNAWPRKISLPNVNSMVLAGFRRSARTRGDIKKRDAVSCDFCNQEFSCFQNRDPFVKHVDESPSCCFVKMFIGSNSFDLGSDIESPEWDTSFYQMRRSTFTFWPRGVGFSADLMAERGFLYTGKGDVVTCMFGCCTLANWHCNDIIEKRHKQANPECPVVKILYP